MSFNFGNPMTSPSTGFSFGTPAGDAKPVKPEISLFGSTTTQSSGSFNAPPSGNNTLNATSAQSTPLFGASAFGSAVTLGASTFGTGAPSFGVSRAVPTVPLAYSASTSSAPLVLGTQTVQPAPSLFGTTEQQTFRSSSKSSLLDNTLPSFAAASHVIAPMFASSTLQPAVSATIPQSNLPAFGVAQVAAVSGVGMPAQATVQSFSVAPQTIGGSSFGTPAQAAVQSFSVAPQTIGGSSFGTPALATVQSFSAAPQAIGGSSFGIPQSTTTAPQFTFGSNMLTMPNITATASTSSTTPALSIPSVVPQRQTTGTIQPTLASFNLGSNTAATRASTLETLDSTSVPSSSLPITLSTITTTTSVPAVNNTTSAPLYFDSETAAKTTTITTTNSNITVTTPIPNTAGIISASTGGLIGTTYGTTSTTTGITPPTIMSYRKLEDLINKWALDLENQSKIFTNQAKQLNAWDRLLISNGDKILSLNNSIERVKDQQHQLDQELDFIRAQQTELEHLIVPMEKELLKAPVIDTDRNHTYQLAENMDSQLKQMSEDLKEIIETLNESNKNQELTNPILQIGRILNAHMNSLQWIDVNTNKISSQLDQISKMHDLTRRNHEIVLQKTYD